MLTALRLARLEQGKSQFHIAKETGISQAMLSLFERELREPKSEHKRALAKVLRRRMKDLWPNGELDGQG